jgi:hypothetical protein
MRVANYWPELRNKGTTELQSELEVMAKAVTDPFKYYCENRKPVRQPGVLIRAVLPRAKPGIDLNTASRQQNQALDSIRKRVAYTFFYATGLKPRGWNLWWGPSHHLQISRNEIDEAAIAGASEFAVFDPGNSINGSSYYFVSSAGSDPVYFAHQSVFQRSGVRRLSTEYPPLKALIEKYTLLIDDEREQKRFMSGGNWSSSIWTELDWVWTRYFEKYTTIKEAADPEGVFMTFDVSLDMRFFCANGRTISDILSK